MGQLDDILAPLSRAISASKELKELSINEEGFLWKEIAGKGWVREKAPWVKADYCLNMCQTLGHSTNMGFSPKRPMVACMLAGGHRFQGLVSEVNVRSGIAISVRVKRPFRATWENYGVSDTSKPVLGPVLGGPDLEEEKESWKEQKTWLSRHPPASPAWLEDIIRQGAPILVSGGTSSGKTTFINSLILPRLPKDARVITIQDVPELDIPQANRVEIIVPRVKHADMSQLTYGDVIDNVNRLNPSTLILGELSVDNAFGAVRLLNMGEASFIASIHANSPLEALDAFRRNVQLSGNASDGVVGLLSRTIGAIVQLKYHTKKGIPQIEQIADPAALDWRAVVDDVGMGSEISGIRSALERKRRG